MHLDVELFDQFCAHLVMCDDHTGDLVGLLSNAIPAGYHCGKRPLCLDGIRYSFIRLVAVVVGRDGLRRGMRKVTATVAW